MINYLNILKSNIFEIAFSALLIRVLIVGASFPEALMVLGLLATIAYVRHYLTIQANEKESVSDEEMKQMKKAIETLEFNAGIKRQVNGQKK